MLRATWSFFTAYSKAHSSPGKKSTSKRVHIHFFTSPTEVRGSGRVERLRLERNRLESKGERLSAVGTGNFEYLDTGLLLRSVGYRSQPLEGVPFDEKRGIIPNRGGRVTTLEGEVVNGEYTSGWVRRGPSGVIGTNKTDAEETVRNLLVDVAPDQAETRTDITFLLKHKWVRYVTSKDWQHIVNTERRNGAGVGRKSLKFASAREMLEVL